MSASRPSRLPMEQQERLCAYFTNRYPDIKKIKVGSNNKRAYNVRVHYREGDVNRTFVVSAYTYESLIICVAKKFTQCEEENKVIR